MTPPWTLRRATPSDAEAIASTHIASSDEAYAPLADVWPKVDVAVRAAKWGAHLAAPASPFVLVAEAPTAGVIGFVEGGAPRRKDPGADSEIWVIHVLPTWRGRGVGHALWDAVVAEIRGPELRAMYVDTVAELRCCAFYEARGGALVERRPTDFHGATRTHVTYFWSAGAS